MPRRSSTPTSRSFHARRTFASFLCARAILVIPVLAIPVFAQAGPWESRRARLDRVHAVGDFRVFYALAGPDALPPAGRVDSDGDGTPDFVQNVAIQIGVADRAYREVLRLRPPLESPRYREVSRIDVHLLGSPIESGSSLKGMAYDGVIDFKRPMDAKSPLKSLCIDVAAGIETRNITPAHELFHLFQNGYTLFKNRWYTEGSARWIETLFKEGAGEAGEIPRDESAKRALFRSSYEAGGFWLRLARDADAKGRVAFPPGLAEVRYVGAGGGSRPVIEDDRFHGADLVRAVLESLDAEDDVVSRHDGLDPGHWDEARQKSAQNDPDIWKAVVRAR